MAENDGRLLGLYDELTTFLTQINLYKSKGLSDSHDLAVFLQLYNGIGWSRRTGMHSLTAVVTVYTLYVEWLSSKMWQEICVSTQVFTKYPVATYVSVRNAALDRT